MNFLTTVFKFLNLIGGFATVGALLSMAFLVINKDGFLTTSGEKVRGFLKITSIVWVVGAFGTILFTLAQILGTTFSDAFDLTVIRSFITQISLGKYLAFQALVAAIEFSPTQLRIANLTAVAPDSSKSRKGLRFWKKEPDRRPEVAHIAKDRIVVEPWDDSRPGRPRVARR